jgi:adenosylcobinamide amidohydrolase
MIRDITVDVDAEAVVVSSRAPLRALSSAVIEGGFASVYAIVNLRVSGAEACADMAGRLTAFAERRRIASPYVGLLTAASTERAAIAEAEPGAIPALAVVTVGLGNCISSGRDPVTAWTPSTINTVVVVDADPEPAALVNAVITATEAKVRALADAGVRRADGGLITGTSTDAVVIAATGRGERSRFGGPVSELGWSVARAVTRAMALGIADWQERHR